MTELSHIRDLECRIHSLFPDFPDRSLLDELMYLLDELQVIHGELDKCDVPNTDSSCIDLTLSQRVAFLVREHKAAQEVRKETEQLHLF